MHREYVALHHLQTAQLACQEGPSFNLNRVDKCPPPHSILSQFNSVHTHTPYSSKKARFNTVFPCMTSSTKRFPLHEIFRLKLFMHFSSPCKHRIPLHLIIPKFKKVKYEIASVLRIIVAASCILYLENG
jgi:hypothetical protein